MLQFHLASHPGQQVNCAALERTVCQTMPSCRARIQSSSTHVEQNSSGPGGELIKELADYAKAFIGSGDNMQRVIGGDFSKQLNNLDFGPGREFPYIKTAVLEAPLASPTQKIRSGILALLSTENLHDLLRKDGRSDVIRCGRIMTKAKALCKNIALSTTN